MEDAPTRRTVLFATAAVVVAAAGGAGYAALRPEPARGRAAAPPELVAAVAAERDLIALIDAELAAHTSLGQLLTQVRSDHNAHLAALQAAVAAYPGTPPTAPTPTRPQPSGSASAARANVRAAEQRAWTAAASRARVLTGPAATVLASIAACEATHAELLA